MNLTTTRDQLGDDVVALESLPAAVSRRSVAGLNIPSVIEMLEETAYDLAVLAGEQLIDALGRQVSVRYKDERRGIMAPHDVVSEVDEAIESLLRRRLAARHPEHAVLGEEGGLGGAAGAPFTWTIDPIDGTSNFVNGLPFYASAVGVLLDGVPLAGAIWCSTTHALRPGVYHARHGGAFRFEGRAAASSARHAVGRERRLSTAPAPHKHREPGWDHRNFGAIALESAFVAAGVLASARTHTSRTWDVAPGIVLARAAGHEVWTQGADRWEPFERFEDPARWQQPLLFADADAVTALRVGALAL
ncbi:MAG: inositol monophosphatase [Dehalococcoidia bacterium]